MIKALNVLALAASMVLLLVAASYAQIAVSTYHNDNQRTGQNTAEVILTPANVNSSRFGKLFSHVVDGAIFAQPLYLPNVAIPGRGTHNVVYVVTEHDSVYAWDADSHGNNNGLPLWTVSFTDPSARVTAISSKDNPCADAIPDEQGITGTPVIDVGSGTLYVVAATKEGAEFVQRLHALDVSTGAEKFGGPVDIHATVPGIGDGSRGGTITFDPRLQLQRAGLLLQDGVIYIAWAGQCDIPPYHGWVMAYSASTLKQLAVFNTTPNAAAGGVWQSGSGLAADTGGSVYLSTGNGGFDAAFGGTNFGDSIIKFSPIHGGLSVADYFTPFDQQEMQITDLDLGSGGILVLPDQPGTSPHLLVQAGKGGTIYLIDRDHMGGFNALNNSQIVQSIPARAGLSGMMFGVPAYWNGHLYFWESYACMRSFALSGGRLSDSPTATTARVYIYPGATPAVSAEGNMNGIVWTIEADQTIAVLRAFDALSLVELYDSEKNAGRDRLGDKVRFSVPTIANGRVYAGTWKELAVYGLLQ